MNWKVKLSNDETFTEGEGEFAVVKGEKSPYLKLKDYLIEKDLKIIELSLIRGQVQFNLPTNENKPKFADFSKLQEPAELNFFRKLGMDLDGSNKQDLFAVIEAIYPDHKLQLWVDENSEKCWAVII
jgi:hypothetical protein